MSQQQFRARSVPEKINSSGHVRVRPWIGGSGRPQKPESTFGGWNERIKRVRHVIQIKGQIRLEFLSHALYAADPLG